jgi:2-oxoglutarate ferredoxin oxidoreductase subunit alpha
MEGNEAIGWGAVAAGCNFFAGYPITPATIIFNTTHGTNGYITTDPEEIAMMQERLNVKNAGRPITRNDCHQGRRR